MAAWIDRAAILGTHDKRWRYSRRSAGLGPRGPFCSGAAPGPRPPPLGSCAIPVPPRSCARPLLRARPLLARRRSARASLPRPDSGRRAARPRWDPAAAQAGRVVRSHLDHGVLRPTALRLRARGTSTLLGRIRTRALIGPPALLLASGCRTGRRATALLGSAAFPALGFCGLSALLGTRRRGRALRGAGLFATDLAALRFWCFAAPFGRRAGLTFRGAAALRASQVVCAPRPRSACRAVAAVARCSAHPVAAVAGQCPEFRGAAVLLRPAGRTRSARRFTPRFGRCSGLAFLPNRAGPGTRLTRLLRLAGGSRRILAEPALLAGSERRRQRYIPGGLNRRLLFSRLSFRGRSGVRSCEPRSHSGRRPSRPVPAGGPRRGAADGRLPPR